MRKMTEANLKAAFAGESQAHIKYEIFADVAKEGGLENVARLFRAIAYAERVHARNHLEALGLVGTTSGNLKAAIDGETYEVEEMYPAFNAVARLQGESGAEKTTRWALEAEKVHAALYQKVKQAVDAGKDAEIGDIYVCSKCGFTVEGEKPNRCPLCGASADKLIKF